MKNFRFSLLIICLCFSAWMATGQSQKEMMKIINPKADSIINLYQKYGSFTKDMETLSESYIKEFQGLFTDYNVQLYNDLDPKQDPPYYVPLDKYIQFVRS